MVSASMKTSALPKMDVSLGGIIRSRMRSVHVITGLFLLEFFFSHFMSGLLTKTFLQMSYKVFDMKILKSVSEETP